VEDLRRVEAQNRQITTVQDAGTILSDAECVGSIVDNLKAIHVCHSLNAFYITGNTVAMYGHDRGCRRCNGFFNLSGVQVTIDRVDIYEYGLQTVPQYRMCGSDEWVGSGDNFAGDTQ